MKYPIFFSIAILLFSCGQNDSDRIENDSDKWMADFSPGVLGWSATEKLDYSQNKLKLKIKNISNQKDFHVSIKDSTLVNYWEDSGFDFLDYSCINIHKVLFMITTNFESKNKSYIGIRAYYNRSQGKWIYAKKFNETENKKAHFALNTILKLL